MPTDTPRLGHLAQAAQRALGIPGHAGLAREIRGLPGTTSLTSLGLIRRAYFPERVSAIHQGCWLQLSPLNEHERFYEAALDLTDVPTARSMLTALILALGYDPGPLGLACSWYPCNGWAARGAQSTAPYVALFVSTLGRDQACLPAAECRRRGWWLAPEVAAQPADVVALGRALTHVLEVSP